MGSGVRYPSVMGRVFSSVTSPMQSSRGRRTEVWTIAVTTSPQWNITCRPGSPPAAGRSLTGARWWPAPARQPSSTTTLSSRRRSSRSGTLSVGSVQRILFYWNDHIEISRVLPWEPSSWYTLLAYWLEASCTAIWRTGLDGSPRCCSPSFSAQHQSSLGPSTPTCSVSTPTPPPGYPVIIVKLA